MKSNAITQQSIEILEKKSKSMVSFIHFTDIDGNFEAGNIVRNLEKKKKLNKHSFPSFFFLLLFYPIIQYAIGLKILRA